MLNVYGIVISALVSGSGVWVIAILIHNHQIGNAPLPLPPPQEHILATLRAARELGDEGDLEALAASLYAPIRASSQPSTAPRCEFCSDARTHRAKSFKNTDMRGWANLCDFHLACFNQRHARTGYVVGHFAFEPEKIEHVYHP